MALASPMNLHLLHAYHLDLLEKLIPEDLTLWFLNKIFERKGRGGEDVNVDS